MNEQLHSDARENRLLAIRKEAEEKGIVSAQGIRPAGSPMPIASPETGYYQQPMLKEPQWTQLIPFYFFVGGASGALGVIGSLADLLGGEEELAKRARWMATGGAMLSGVLLVVDLGRPSRFLNMLRVFKPQSAMSMGSWILTGFSIFASTSSFADLMSMMFGDCVLLKMIRMMGRVGTVLFGMPFHNYTGVLIGASVIPVWNNRIHVLPREFGMSGLQSAVSLLELTGSDHPALNAVGLLSATVETYEGVELHMDQDRALKSAKQGLSGALVQLGGILSGPLPMALRLASLFVKNKRPLRRAAAVSAIAGSICLRYGWVEAGKGSSRDWRIPMEIDEPKEVLKAG